MPTILRPLERSDEAALRSVMEAASEADRYPGFTAWDLAEELGSLIGFAGPDGPLVAVDEGAIVGYCSPRHDDLTVHPNHRRRGHGRRLLAATLRRAAARGEESISIYVPKDGAGKAFAVAMGMRYHSSLWRMELAPETPVAAAAFPAGFAARGYGDWLPLARYVALINEGFIGHPTPVSWSEEAVAYAQSQPGFDPSGIQVVCPENDPDEPVGFVRVVPTGADEAGRPGGEIRMVGVRPAWRRHGLGRELLRWGVARLRESGAATIQLTVEAENEHALGLYERTGFVKAIEWPHWSIATNAAIPGAD